MTDIDNDVWADAKCRDGDTDWWFPHTAGSSPNRFDDRRRVCLPCPVRDTCLDYAIEHRIDDGIWGGMDEHQRVRIRKDRTTIEIEWERYHARVRHRAHVRHKRAIDRANADTIEWARTIATGVAKSYGLTFADLVSRARERDVVSARHKAMWEVASQTTLPLTAIGGLFDRDHSTVSHGIDRHEQVVQTEQFRAKAAS